MPMTLPDDTQVAELARLGVEPLGSAPAIERYLRSVLAGEPTLDAIEVHNAAFAALLRLQGQSVSWATTEGGWTIDNLAKDPQ